MARDRTLRASAAGALYGGAATPTLVRYFGAVSVWITRGSTIQANTRQTSVTAHRSWTTCRRVAALPVVSVRRTAVPETRPGAVTVRSLLTSTGTV